MSDCDCALSSTSSASFLNFSLSISPTTINISIAFGSFTLWHSMDVYRKLVRWKYQVKTNVTNVHTHTHTQTIETNSRLELWQRRNKTKSNISEHSRCAKVSKQQEWQKSTSSFQLTWTAGHRQNANRMQKQSNKISIKPQIRIRAQFNVLRV